ncbi:MAG TPA: N-acetylglutaminylglutamine synthetase [Hyphomicrobiales bacterium]|nr:N-acetylglutaminylglutamine synthetase [Hyphomicrobiales bacterium]
MVPKRQALEPDDLTEMASLKHWGELPESAHEAELSNDVVIDCGWGRLMFGQTFADPDHLADVLQDEQQGQRDVALYVREPHVLLSRAPHALFLDPSHTFRLNLEAAGPLKPTENGLKIREARAGDQTAINTIYLARNMVPVVEDYVGSERQPACVSILVAEDRANGEITGVVMGVDHRAAFDDPDNGSSLWALAVDTQAKLPGVGRKLVEALAARFQEAGRSFMDLSVMHDNQEAISLYRKLGFGQVPVYCVKKKNPVNEKLYIGPASRENLNPYAQIIVDEARRRGIAVEIEDAAAGLFSLSLGGRSICCRESLCDLTSAVAMSRCDDKTLTHRLLAKAGLSVPAQAIVKKDEEAVSFLKRHERVVVKPARGEQGHGVFVDLTAKEQVLSALKQARELCDTVLIEQFVTGEDLRVIVIGGEVVAAAVRRPAAILGDGVHTIVELIDKQSRRRAAATGGESLIPLDEETERCVEQAGYQMLDVLPAETELQVRKTANLHTGGTIHDVTPELHPDLAEASVKAAEVLHMPVVGLDLIVESPDKPAHYLIEANERPGLANHEPAPTAERFIDLLFPETQTRSVAGASAK